jgi:hypothetical protein
MAKFSKKHFSLLNAFLLGPATCEFVQADSFLYFPAKIKKNNSLQKMQQAPSRGQFQMQELRCRPPKKPDSPRMTLFSCEEQHIKSY